MYTYSCFSLIKIFINFLQLNIIYIKRLPVFDFKSYIYNILGPAE